MNDEHLEELYLNGNLHLSVEKSANVMFALTQHGGHMGFFEGAVLLPHPLTWMDRAIVEYADAIYLWEGSRAACRRRRYQQSAE